METSPNGYFPISEMPKSRRGVRPSKWPWDEWEKVPVGMAKDVTAEIEAIRGEPVTTVKQATNRSLVLKNAAKKRGLVTVSRNGRIYLARPHEGQRV